MTDDYVPTTGHILLAMSIAGWDEAAVERWIKTLYDKAYLDGYRAKEAEIEQGIL